MKSFKQFQIIGEATLLDKKKWHELFNIFTSEIYDELQVLDPEDMGLDVDEKDMLKIYSLKKLPSDRKEKETLKKAVEFYADANRRGWHDGISDRMEDMFGREISVKEVLDIAKKLR